MKSEQFNHLRNTFNSECEKLLNIKAEDYADGKDRLYNFKETAKRLGITTRIALGVLWLKHAIAFEQFLEKNTSASQSIRERLMDLRNYIDLCIGLLEEEKNTKDPIGSILFTIQYYLHDKLIKEDHAKLLDEYSMTVPNGIIDIKRNGPEGIIVNYSQNSKLIQTYSFKEIADGVASVAIPDGLIRIICNKQNNI